jgi:outer membrane protein TolC
VDAQKTVRSAQQDEAVAQYARLALRALGDVESALAGGRMLADRERVLSQVVDDRGRTLDFTQSNYKVGRQDLRAVEQQQLGLYDARIQLLRVQADQLAQRINLHLALGGSFSPPAQAAVAPRTDRVAAR